LAREVVKRLNPGKSGNAKEITYWLKSHSDADPPLILVDDFAGTGDTIVNSFQKWKAEFKDQRIIDTLLERWSRAG
jgi:hypothetical protein